MEASTREIVIQELANLPEIGMLEVLDFVRFLKMQLEQMSPEERFDRAWAISRRIASEHGITDQDMEAEIRAARQQQ